MPRQLHRNQEETLEKPTATSQIATLQPSWKGERSRSSIVKTLPHSWGLLCVISLCLSCTPGREGKTDSAFLSQGVCCPHNSSSFWGRLGVPRPHLELSWLQRVQHAALVSPRPLPNAECLPQVLHLGWIPGGCCFMLGFLLCNFRPALGLSSSWSASAPSPLTQ